MRKLRSRKERGKEECEEEWRYREGGQQGRRKKGKREAHLESWTVDHCTMNTHK